MEIHIMAAVASNGAIGYKGKLPWKSFPEDMIRFKQLTQEHTVLMGTKTHASLPARFCPLPRRHNLVLSRKESLRLEGCFVVHTWEEAQKRAYALNTKKLFVIGGPALYALAFPYAHYLHLTYIHDVFEGDTFFPSYDASSWQSLRVEKGKSRKGGFFFEYMQYKRKDTP